MKLSMNDRHSAVSLKDDYDLSLLARCVAEQWKIGSFGEVLGPVESDSISTLSVSLTLWEARGLSIYRLNEALMAKLLLTDPGSLPLNEIPLPHQTFVVRIPHGWWSIDGRPVPWLVFSVVKARGIRRILTPGQYTAADLQHAWRLLFLSPADRMLWKTIYPDECLSFDRMVNEKVTERTALPINDRDSLLIRAAWRLVVNLSLYVAECSAGQKLGPQRRTSFGEIIPPKAPQPDVWLLGKGVLCEPELIQTAKDWVTCVQGTRAPWRISKRFVVCGHWRNQACGRMRTERVRKWIQPHWKGVGPKMQHVYSVVDEDSPLMVGDST